MKHEHETSQHENAKIIIVTFVTQTIHVYEIFELSPPLILEEFNTKEHQQRKEIKT